MGAGAEDELQPAALEPLLIEITRK